ncbi:MAG: beta-glycosidase [Actinomycetota bacterium]|nr:beta-glycosidase [Actinomycetota bacterium]
MSVATEGHGRGRRVLPRVNRVVLAILAAATAIFAIVGAIRLRQVTTPPPPAAIGHVSAAGQQVIDGFGASGAWWSGPVYGMPVATRQDVGKLLFSSSGLELSQFRYNIGGGGVGVRTPWKVAPTFLTASGSYNFGADPAGLYFLKMASSYHVRDLIGFVNSAPAVFTSNHQSCGGTLIRSDIAAYAKYVTNVVVGIRRHFGVKLNYVSPMNEPDGAMSPCVQEGMRVPVGERAAVVVDLGRDLAGRAPWAKEIADESSQVAFQLMPELPRWVHRDGAGQYIAYVAHHTYDYPGPRVLSAMHALLKRLGLRSWMTEICCYNGARFGYQYDPTMVSGMWLAKSIYNDLVYGGDSAFQWWTALSPNLGCEPASDKGCAERANILGRNDGLVYYDINYHQDGDTTLYTTKRYYVMGNYSRFVPPGSVLHRVTGLPPGLEALAALKKGRWSLVLIDDRAPNSPQFRVAIALPGHPGGLRLEASAVTSQSASWARVKDVAVSHGGVVSFPTSGQDVISLELGAAGASA